MKTILQPFSTLPEPYRSQAIENYDNKHKNAASLPNALVLAFDWGQSKQGYNVWMKVWLDMIPSL